MENKLGMSFFMDELKHYRLPKAFLAGFWIRTLAFAIDWVIITAIQSILLNLTLYRFIGLHLSDSFIVTIIELLIFVSYFYLTTRYLKGQTPGKLLCGIRVFPLNYEEESLNQFYIMRELIGKVIFFYFPYIAVLLVFSYKKQHILDILVDSIVIRESQIEEIRTYFERGFSENNQTIGENNELFR